jgi:hexosaminidase
MVVPGYTELAAKGAYSSSQVYTPSDIQNIVSYANARGIDVLVEIDTPGHESAIADAYPDYVACAQSTPWASFANEPPAGQLRLASPEVQNFTAGLFAATAKMFTSKLFSTGGDELNLNCYAQDEPTQKILNETGQTIYQALDTFTEVTHGALLKEGKIPVVWEGNVSGPFVLFPNSY